MGILNIEELNISVNGEKKINNASFSIDNGDVVLLTGPNGSGKSTIIKAIMGDLFDYGNSIEVSASALGFCDDGKEYDLKANEKFREHFRKIVCYISQDDDFESESVLDCFLVSLEYLKLDNPKRYALDFIKDYHIYECFEIADENMDFKIKKLLLSAGFSSNEITTEYVKSAKYLSMNTKKMSGGQKKLTNILSNLVKCEFSRLVFFDEPLNNLDYNNVRMFSNIITKLHQAHPDVAMVIVTHCRSIPIINRVLEIDVNTKELKSGKDYICNSCFGRTNELGLYV